MTRARQQIAILLTSLAIAAPAIAASPSGADDTWNFGVEAYLWGANIDITTSTSTDYEIRFSDLVENLDVAFMGTLDAKRGKWTLLSDIIYLDVDDNVEDQLAPAIELKNLSLEAWIVTPAVAYRMFENERFELDLVGGARYLWIDLGQKFNFSAPLPPGQSKDNESGSVWDAIVGVRGEWQFNDKWYLTYRTDVGAGDSDLVWQAFGAVGYRFTRFHALVGYRYLDWDLDGDALHDLTLSGVAAGVKFTF